MGFEVPDKLLREVAYEDKPIDVNVIQDSLDFKLSPSDENRLLLTKYSGWRHESERRQIIDLAQLTPEFGLYFFPFSENLVLREVRLGPRCELGIAALRRLVTRKNSSVEVIKCRNAFGQFKVVKNESGTKDKGPLSPSRNKPSPVAT